MKSREIGESDPNLNPQSGADVVAEFFHAAIDHPNYRAIVGAVDGALIHDSYLYENQASYPGLTRGVLNALEGYGQSWVDRELGVRYYLSRDFAVLSDLVELHKTGHAEFSKWVDTLEWISECGRLGKGQGQSGFNSKIRLQLAYQVVGAIALAGAEPNLKKGLQPFFVKALALEARDATDALTVVHARLGAEARWTYTSSGPDHQKTFCAVLSASGGRSASGQGASKKVARSVAAQAFIDLYPKQVGAKSPTLRRTERFVWPAEFSVPPATRMAVEQIQRDFGLDARWVPLMLQALIHSSWAYENKKILAGANQKENLFLAFVGSIVTWSEYARSIASRAVAEKPAEASMIKLTEKQLADCFAALGLDAAVLLGRGEEHGRGSKGSISANSLQALVAVLYIALQTPPEICTQLSASWAPLRDVLAPSTPHQKDPKTRLQEFASACSISLSYDVRVEGPDHNRRFLAEVLLTSALLGRSTAVRGSWLSSRKAAAQDAAERVVGVFDALGPELLVTEPPRILGTVFVLNQMLEAAQENPQSAQRWTKLGLLGTSVDRLDELLNWARAADSLLSGHEFNEIDPQQLAAFYRNSRIRKDRLKFAALALTEVAGQAKNLTSPSDITEDLEAKLSRLSALYRSAAEEVDSGTAVETLVADWKTLWRNQIKTEGKVGPVILSRGEQSMLDFFVGLLADSGQDLRIRCGTGDIRVEVSDASLLGSLSDSIQLFSDLSPLVSVSVDSSALCVAFAYGANESDGPITRAVWAGLQPESSPLSASIANILHDMKNQIAAARQGAVIPANVIGTARLAKELSASEHLDRAKGLAAQLLSAGSLASLGSGNTELASFTRNYCAELLRRLPIHFSIVPEVPKAALSVNVDPAHMTAILDNLVKNSLEAMPQGGTLRLNCAAENGFAVLLFSDDGPGVPNSVAEALTSGASVRSTKPSGNGLGLLSIRNLVDLANGSFDYAPQSTGACWRIALPVADTES